MEKRYFSDEEVREYMEEKKQHIFYFNKEDKRVFVAKYYGGGWTINFARPIAWLFFVGAVALFISIIIGVTFN